MPPKVTLNNLPGGSITGLASSGSGENKQLIRLDWIGAPPPDPALYSDDPPTELPQPWGSAIRPLPDLDVEVTMQHWEDGEYKDSFAIKWSDTEVWATDVESNGDYENSQIVFE